MDEKQYYYVVTRTDLDLADQACQAIHAATDAGKYFGIKEDCNLVFLRVDNREQLLKLSAILRRDKIQHTRQVEPDLNNEETALATCMLSGNERRYFRGLKLWPVSTMC